MTAQPNIRRQEPELTERPSKLTQRSVDRVLKSLERMNVTTFEIIVEGNGFRVIVGDRQETGDDVAKRIEALG